MSALGDPSVHSGFLAHALLASVRSDLLEHLTTVQSRSEDELRADVGELVERVVRRRD